MITVAELPVSLPIFPLPGALLLPRARLPLHVFEPRYLQMVDDCFKGSTRMIGMVQPQENGDDLSAVGCAGRISGLTETEDGRYMITLTGVSRFRIEKELEATTPYRQCEVSWEFANSDIGSPERDQGLERKTFIKLLNRYFDEAELQTDWDSLHAADDELLINSLAMLCPFEPSEKQALLEAKSLSERREALAALMEFALYGKAHEEMM